MPNRRLSSTTRLGDRIGDELELLPQGGVVGPEVLQPEWRLCMPVGEVVEQKELERGGLQPFDTVLAPISADGLRADLRAERFQLRKRHVKNAAATEVKGALRQRDLPAFDFALKLSKCDSVGSDREVLFAPVAGDVPKAVAPEDGQRARRSTKLARESTTR